MVQMCYILSLLRTFISRFHAGAAIAVPFNANVADLVVKGKVPDINTTRTLYYSWRVPLN